MLCSWLRQKSAEFLRMTRTLQISSIDNLMIESQYY